MTTSSIKILVVDDDQDIRNGTAHALGKAGYSVAQAASGEEALEFVKTFLPDLLLLDRQLPGIDGLEVCRQLKGDPMTAVCFVILASGVYSESEDMVEGFEGGADGYICRPINNRELLARVATYARLIKLQSALRKKAEDLEISAQAAEASQMASINLMEDAVAAREQMEVANRELLNEIAERKRAEEEARASEQRYRLLFDSSPIPMWLFDLETLRFLSVNEVAVRQYGYSLEEFLAMTIKDIRPPEEIPRLLESVASDRGRGLRMSEWRHQRKDGSIIRVEIVSNTIDYFGRAARLVLAQDITEKRLLEEKFLHAQRLESLGMLAAGIAHDLNNVLSPIMLAAPMLRGSQQDTRNQRILDTLERSAGRGASLVKQILGFVRTTSDDFQVTQVKHILREVVSVIEETFPKSIQFDHSIPPDLWTVQGNTTQIHQVVLNLCVNARDAMPDGGTLTLAATNRHLDAKEAELIPGGRAGDWLVVEVSDTGTGIAPEMLESIWTPFFTTKALGKGTGLGLSTVRTIVVRHGGFAELLTQVGKGTTFRIYLPSTEGRASAAKNKDTLTAISEGSGELILVVDDDHSVRTVVVTMLQEHGYRVLDCVDGIEAIEAFNTHPGQIPLLITDLDMPRLGGVALARALLEIQPDLRVLAISGLSHNGNGGSDVPAIRKIAHAFLIKPFKPEELLYVLHDLLHPKKSV